jgi:2,3-bisphosphoglycerate-dependent phosphoglycerate mutase
MQARVTALVPRRPIWDNTYMTNNNKRPSIGQLVLLRHGQSDWNQKNLFTGWTDVDLTAQGRDEARQAGRTLLDAGLTFDMAFTSVLTRAIRTLWLVLDEMKLMWIPVENSWRLNERHYGSLQGLDKAQTTAQHGEAQVKIWRRSYDIPPPPLQQSDDRHPQHDLRYASLTPTVLPATESLKTTLARVQPYWEDRIAPEILRGRNVLVAAHGNSLRAVVKMLEGVSDEEITELNIPTGVPRLYELDAALKPKHAAYLGDAAAIAAAAEAVANQAKAKK